MNNLPGLFLRPTQNQNQNQTSSSWSACRENAALGCLAIEKWT
jgi:hypothetical protein